MQRKCATNNETLLDTHRRFSALKHGSSIFFPDGPAGGATRWANNPQALAAWKEGRTGWPLVDANMRELAATGGQLARG